MEGNIVSILNNLVKFSDTILSLGSPIIDSRLGDFEKNIGYKLPIDFKYFITKHNGFSLLGTEVNGLGKEFLNASLDKIYDIEHKEVGNSMPKEFLPFSADGQGNHYCLDLSRINNEVCPVVFWQHDAHYLTLKEVETCNDSFVDWVNEVMIEWTLEDYDYDGSEK